MFCCTPPQNTIHTGTVFMAVIHIVLCFLSASRGSISTLSHYFRKSDCGVHGDEPPKSPFKRGLVAAAQLQRAASASD